MKFTIYLKKQQPAFSHFLLSALYRKPYTPITNELHILKYEISKIIISDAMENTEIFDFA